MSTIISTPATSAEGRRSVARFRAEQRVARRKLGDERREEARRRAIAGAQWTALAAVRSTLERASARLGLPASSLRWAEGGVWVGDARVPEAVYA